MKTTFRCRRRRDARWRERGRSAQNEATFPLRPEGTPPRALDPEDVSNSLSEHSGCPRGRPRARRAPGTRPPTRPQLMESLSPRRPGEAHERSPGHDVTQRRLIRGDISELRTLIHRHSSRTLPLPTSRPPARPHPLGSGNSGSRRPEPPAPLLAVLQTRRSAFIPRAQRSVDWGMQARGGGTARGEASALDRGLSDAGYHLALILVILEGLARMKRKDCCL
jgi:hypothetical protein